ncbi:DRC1 protein, partial [Sitta europaea]|nr:DRC1 protein [Sitta europaea]
DPAAPAPDSLRDELQGPGSPIPDLSIRADEILRILREFLRDFQKLRDEGPPKEIQDSRDSSRDGEYWECLTRVIPERTLRLWDALGAALPEYHKVLARRAELFSEATALQRQNS